MIVKSQKYLETINTIEIIQYSKKIQKKANIKKLDKKLYCVLSTGQVLQINNKQWRTQDLSAIKQTFEKVRNIVNSNFTSNNSIWVTITYKENMTDLKRLKSDRQKYWQKMKYKYPKLEFLSVVEPQERGAWHMHELYKNNDDTPLYIPQKIMYNAWGHGSVTVKKVQSVTNLGAYLTAYLSNIKNGIKNSRLSMYPAGMRIYRRSRGIVKPSYEYVNDVTEFGGLETIYDKTYYVKINGMKMMKRIITKRKEAR